MRLIGFAVVSLPWATACHLMQALGLDISKARQMYFRTTGRILGLRVIVRGRQSTDAPQLIVANHISYLDIFALGGAAHGVFVAKSEINGWPVFGWMGRSGGTVFVNRRRAAAGKARNQMRERLAHGETLIMFPEATSNDGNHIKPFKSALFDAAEKAMPDGRPITVQPVSIAYTRLNNLPLGIGWRPFFAWYGDMELMPHVWQALRAGTVTAEITFHPPVMSDAFNNRKALAKYCETVTGNGVARLLMGREAA
jgi:1-acyl-sn-glycerol-3-phosphate acyltransferase